MSKFKKKGSGGAPAMNTASLPDIVFMLLFFFMVATTSKETDPTVQVASPTGTKTMDLTPYKQRSEIDFLYLGKPRNANRKRNADKEFALSLDNVVQASSDGLYSTNEVGQWKVDKKSQKPARMKAPIEAVITCLKIDGEAPCKLIFEIRKQLLDVKALTIAYSVRDNGNI